MRKLIALAIDDEFTHFDMVGGDLISIGLVEVYEDLSLGREFQGFCKPRSTRYFSEKAQAVHGISYFKAQTFPEARETMIDLIQWLAPLMDQFPLITLYYGSWNFDLKWLETTMERCGLKQSFAKAFDGRKESHINVLKMVRHFLKTIPDTKDENGKTITHTLGNVADFYGMEKDHHNSIWDARATAQIYGKIKRGEKVWTGELI